MRFISAKFTMAALAAATAGITLAGCTVRETTYVHEEYPERQRIVVREAPPPPVVVVRERPAAPRRHRPRVPGPAPCRRLPGTTAPHGRGRRSRTPPGGPRRRPQPSARRLRRTHPTATFAVCMSGPPAIGPPNAISGSGSAASGHSRPCANAVYVKPHWESRGSEFHFSVGVWK